ncbi:MAG: tyrosine-type recombinase/integrase [Bacteroidetes bacterium]|nr:tyrosine-type recombinase/integrase [Bacteroidota bacterium]
MRENFKEYLIKSGYSKIIIKQRQSYSDKYLEWLTKNDIKIEETEYKDLLNYISHLQSEKLKPYYINQQILGIGSYYKYKKLPDITYKVRILGTEKRKSLLLNEKQLNEIYDNYIAREKEEKEILSLIIYQGLMRLELLKLTIESINLERGEILIPDTSYKNSRILRLSANQILPFYNHIKTKKGHNELLFKNCKGYWKLSDLLYRITKKLKEKDKRVSLKQLRQSRYGLLIRKYGLRQGQYKCGFRSIQTAEEYKSKDITDLKASILKYHPLNEL